MGSKKGNLTRKIFEKTKNTDKNLKNRYKIIRRKSLYSPYCDKTAAKQIESVLNEFNEVKDAIKTENMEEIEEELSDAIYVLLMFIERLVEEGKLDSKFFTKSGIAIHEKITKRSPHLLEGEKISQKKEDNIRNKTKEENNKK